MRCHQKNAAVFIRVMVLAFWLVSAMSDTAVAHSQKYDKCHAKCVQRAGKCLEDAGEMGDDEKRAHKKKECEHREKECVEECDE